MPSSSQCCGSTAPCTLRVHECARVSARTCDTSRPAPDLNISCHECFRGTGGDGATARSIQGRGEAPAGGAGGAGGGGRGCG